MSLILQLTVLGTRNPEKTTMQQHRQKQHLLHDKLTPETQTFGALLLLSGSDCNNKPHLGDWILLSTESNLIPGTKLILGIHFLKKPRLLVSQEKQSNLDIQDVPKIQSHSQTCWFLLPLPDYMDTQLWINIYKQIHTHTDPGRDLRYTGLHRESVQES